MKKNMAAILLPTLILLSCSTTQEQSGSGFDFARYRPYTISSILRDHAYAAGNSETSGGQISKGHIGITAKNFPYKISVVYVGEEREIEKEAETLIGFWARSLGQENWAEEFKHEILVREGNTDYWIPTQEVLLPYIAEEVKPKELIELYVMWIGYIREGNADGRWVLIANEFQAVN
jgi:hypothetical protein